MSEARLPQIDPRQVPVFQVDHHLPMIASARLQPAALRQRFAIPPCWQPELVAEKKFMDRPPMQAAVLIPIVMRRAPGILFQPSAPSICPPIPVRSLFRWQG